MAAEAEAQHDVRDRVPHPIDGDQVDLVELAQVEGLVVVMRRVVDVRPVVEVADVVDRHPIALEAGVGKLGDVGLPLAVVGRTDRSPHHQEGDEERSEEADRDP